MSVSPAENYCTLMLMLPVESFSTSVFYYYIIALLLLQYSLHLAKISAQCLFVGNHLYFV